MNKIITYLVLITTFLLVSSPTFAEMNLVKPVKGTCAVIIGDSTVKTPDFFKYIDETFNNKEEVKRIASGTEIQGLYKTYWLDKGFLEEQKPTKQDLNDFVKYSGYDKVLFLIVNAPAVEKTKSGNGGWGGWIQREHTRASIGINAFLVNDAAIVKVAEVTKEDDSDTSELRAKRGAFQKCIEDIKNIFSSLI